ncbi:MAG: hypothetical protein R6V47_05410 [Candidatus Delongbacteria bacterium]
MKKFTVIIFSLFLIVSCSKQTRKEEIPARDDQIVYEENRSEDTIQDTQTPSEPDRPVIDETAAGDEAAQIYADPTAGIDDPYVEDGINWSERTIRATGIGAPNPNAPNMAVKRAGAINAAKMVAVRDLLATLKGMYLSSETTVENYMTTSDVVKTQVEGIAKAYRMVGEPKYFEDGSVEVTVEMSINGDLSDLLMKDREFAETETVDEATYKLSDLTGTANAYSGLIVNCKSVQLRPALSPKIYSQSGEEIYGTSNVSREFAVQQGMLGYLKSVEMAGSNARVADNPYVISAIGVKGPNKADIIVSDQDAEKIKDLNSNYNFLKECRVIAVIN